MENWPNACFSPFRALRTPMRIETVLSPYQTRRSSYSKTVEDLTYPLPQSMKPIPRMKVLVVERTTPVVTCNIGSP